MQREARKLLWDMQHAGNAVTEFLAGKALNDYLTDLLLRSAVERQLFIVGEALSQLSRWDEDVLDRIDDCRAIIGFRDRPAHGYSDLDDERVYTVATVGLPRLRIQIEKLLND